MNNKNIDWCIVMGLHETVEIIDNSRLSWYNKCAIHMDARSVLIFDLNTGQTRSRI